MASRAGHAGARLDERRLGGARPDADAWGEYPRAHPVRPVPGLRRRLCPLLRRRPHLLVSALGAARISVEVAAWWRVNRPFPRIVVCAAVANYRRFLLQDREPQGEHVGIRALLRFLSRRGFCELCIVLGVLSGTPAGAQV